MESNTKEESIEDFSKLTYRQRFAITEYGYLLSPENAEVVGKMLGNFQEKDVLPFCQANGKKASGMTRQENENPLGILALTCGAGTVSIFSVLKWILLDSLPFRNDGSLAYKVGQLLFGIWLPMIFCFALPIFGAIGGLMVGILSEIIVDVVKSRPITLAIRSKKIAIIGGIIGGFVVALLVTPAPQ